jgi:hypothetical protein
VYNIAGDFTNIGSVKNIKITTTEFRYNFHDSVKGSYNYVCRVNNVLAHEQELNTKNNSKVKVTYPSD